MAEPTRAEAAWQRARAGQVQHKALMGFRTLRDMHDSVPVAFEKMEFVKTLGGAHDFAEPRPAAIPCTQSAGYLACPSFAWHLVHMTMHELAYDASLQQCHR